MATELKTITVQGVAVEISQPYAAGHTITEAEAKALNQVRAENIGNNMRKTIKDALEEAGGNVEAIQSDIQAKVAEYDKNYEFTLASVGGGSTRLDPLTKECRSIARDFLHSKIKEAGQSVKDYKEANGEEAYKAKIVEISEHPKVVEAAKRALKEREKMASADLPM